MGKRPEISAVVPTRDRRGNLEELLKFLGQQSLPASSFEVVVVNDGSRDGTEQLEGMSLPFAYTMITQPPSGPARARSQGVRTSRSEVVLFLDDDTRPNPCCLEEHLRAHIACPGSSVVGKSTLPFPLDEIDRRVFPNPFGFPRMQKQVLQFRHRQELPWNYFITGNLSVERRLVLEAGLFDERFPFPNYEDMELGYRLQEQLGSKLVFWERATAHHLHYSTVEEKCNWAWRNGYSKGIMITLYPELADRLRLCQSYREYGGADLLELKTLSEAELCRLHSRSREIEEGFRTYPPVDCAGEYDDLVATLLENYEAQGMQAKAQVALNTVAAPPRLPHAGR